MLFSMPSYEVRYQDTQDWEKISETKALGKLHEAYGQIAPVLQKMIDGKQVQTPQAVFRIKGFDETPVG